MTDNHQLSKSELIDIIRQKEKEIVLLEEENALLKQNTSLKDPSEVISFKEILKLMPGNVYWKDVKGKYLGCNNNFSRILNTITDDFLGKSDEDLFKPEIAIPLKKIDQEVMLSGMPLYTEELGINPFKEEAIFLTQKIPLRNNSGEVVGILGVSFDITERKKMEENLQIAKAEAEAAYQGKIQFLAIINHELRTPVTGLLGLLNLLQTDSLPEQEEKNIFATMENCSRHLLNLVNNVLDMSKLEMNQFNFNIGPVNIREPVQEVYNILNPLALEKHLKLRVLIDDDVPNIILSDEQILHQILLNLTNNAIKFTAQGEVIISIQKQNLSSNGKTRLTISVADSGLGIPNDKLDTIFEPFQQLENAYVRQSSRSGTGLGLTIVKKLAELLGLEITVSSTLGKGSIFSLVGDFETQTEELTSKSALSSTKRTSSETILDRLKRRPQVLLVEDDPIIQFIHKKMLNDLGCDVDLATYGRDALKKLNNDIIFMDLSLPDISGFETIKLIRDDSQGIHIPIIALTSYASQEEYVASLKVGASAFVTKPVTSDKLKELILTYVKS